MFVGFIAIIDQMHHQIFFEIAKQHCQKTSWFGA
jgi:hypothetical protein